MMQSGSRGECAGASRGRQAGGPWMGKAGVTWVGEGLGNARVDVVVEQGRDGSDGFQVEPTPAKAGAAGHWKAPEMSTVTGADADPHLSVGSTLALVGASEPWSAARLACTPIAMTQTGTVGAAIDAVRNPFWLRCCLRALATIAS